MDPLRCKETGRRKETLFLKLTREFDACLKRGKTEVALYGGQRLCLEDQVVPKSSGRISGEKKGEWLVNQLCQHSAERPVAQGEDRRALSGRVDSFVREGKKNGASLGVLGDALREKDSFAYREEGVDSHIPEGFLKQRLSVQGRRGERGDGRHGP